MRTPTARCVPRRRATPAAGTPPTVCSRARAPPWAPPASGRSNARRGVACSHGLFLRTGALVSSVLLAPRGRAPREEFPLGVPKAQHFFRGLGTGFWFFRANLLVDFHRASRQETTDPRTAWHRSPRIAAVSSQWCQWCLNMQPRPRTRSCWARCWSRWRLSPGPSPRWTAACRLWCVHGGSIDV